MRKTRNWLMESIDYEAENLKEERELNEAVKAGILEKVGFGTWRAKA